MFKVDLVKKMKGLKTKKTTPQELLQYKEYETLAESGEISNKPLDRVKLGNNINVGEKLYLDKKVRLSLEKKYGKDKIFHINQIEIMCRRYYLRFLNTKFYSGAIDSHLAGKITNFEIAHDMKMVHKKCFMMAPPQNFTLKNTPKTKWLDDPLFFYEVDNDYYCLIHKWGNDFSIFLRLKGFFSGNITTLVLFLLTFITSWFCYSMAVNYNKISELSALFGAVCALSGLISIVFSVSTIMDIFEGKMFNYNPNWNNNKK